MRDVKEYDQELRAAADVLLWVVDSTAASSDCEVIRTREIARKSLKRVRRFLLPEESKPPAPWRKWPDSKPENADTVIAVKRWDDGKLHGGENCYVEGRGWCNLLCIPNPSEPDFWMPMGEYLEYCDNYGTPIK